MTEPQPATAIAADQRPADGRWYWSGAGRVPAPRWARPFAPADACSAALIAAVAAVVAGYLLVLAGVGAEQLTSGLLAVVLVRGGIVLFLAGVLGAAVAAPIWSHRCARNLPALGAARVRRSPRWAAAAWFVPGVNLVVPYRVASDVWAGSARPGERFRPPLLVWWLSWLLALRLLVPGVLAGLDTRVWAGPGDAAGGLGLLLSAVLLVRFVRLVAVRQRERHAALTAARTAPV